jgi:hypothetical protein
MIIQGRQDAPESCHFSGEHQTCLLMSDVSISTEAQDYPVPGLLQRETTCDKSGL